MGRGSTTSPTSPHTWSRPCRCCPCWRPHHLPAMWIAGWVKQGQPTLSADVGWPSRAAAVSGTDGNGPLLESPSPNDLFDSKGLIYSVPMRQKHTSAFAEGPSSVPKLVLPAAQICLLVCSPGCAPPLLRHRSQPSPPSVCCTRGSTRMSTGAGSSSRIGW